MSFVSKHCEYIYGNSDMLETVGMRKEHHPDPGSLVNVRTLGAKSLPIQEVFGAFFESYTTS